MPFIGRLIIGGGDGFMAKDTTVYGYHRRGGLYATFGCPCWQHEGDRDTIVAWAVMACVVAAFAVLLWYFVVYANDEYGHTAAECAMARADHYNNFVRGMGAAGSDVPPEAVVAMWKASSGHPDMLPYVAECRIIVDDKGNRVY